jgi:hypothetical protein
MQGDVFSGILASFGPLMAPNLHLCTAVNSNFKTQAKGRVASFRGFLASFGALMASDCIGMIILSFRVA